MIFLFLFSSRCCANEPNAGVAIPHAAVLDKIPRLSKIIGASDVALSYSELDSVSAIRYLMGTIAHGAARIVSQGAFTVERFLEIIDKFNVTYTLTPVFRTIQLVNHPLIKTANLSSLRHYTSGGVKLPSDVIQRMNKHLTNGKLYQNFGMSESVGTISLTHISNGSVGQLISGAEVKIVNDRGDRLGVKENGELCIKLPYMFLGYIHGGKNIQSCLDGEGFFHTGDIAHFDENGDLFIVDRKKEIFKSDGYHVIPSQIEEFLNQIEGVKQSCVVPIPDPMGDNLPAAIMVQSENSKCTEESILNSVLGRKIYISHILRTFESNTFFIFI